MTKCCKCGANQRWSFEPNLKYRNGRVAVMVKDHGREYGMLSINVEEIELESGEFILNHDLNHNSQFLSEMLTFFEDTGKRVGYGFVRSQPVWRMKPA